MELAADFHGRAGHVAVLLRDEKRGDVADFCGLRPAAEQGLPGDTDVGAGQVLFLVSSLFANRLTVAQCEVSQKTL